ncbi:hypothetical protein BVV20_20425 [Xanthomonas oryzae pv. oryzae]|nr:hypothetical protein BVV20_20425 [Xanthomonas oryzae pv. oryzae]
MICSSEKRFFTSNLLGLGNWTPSRCATQTWGDVDPTLRPLQAEEDQSPMIGKIINDVGEVACFNRPMSAARHCHRLQWC